MFAGEAIGGALRSISNSLQSYSLYYSAHGVKVLADAIFLYIWWQTFRTEAIQREKEERARLMVKGK
jgi:endo-beta-N-acetylglucosaminidase D